MTGNKGEWSEIYALFKVLGDKQLFLGDKDIEKLEGFVYPIISVLRSESNGDFKYSVKDEIIVVSGNDEVLKIPISQFKEKAVFLLQAIKANHKTTFSVPEVEEFMNSINCMSLKAGSSAKTDITIVVHDQRTNQQPTLGFSIKSQLGRASTLLNAGKTTNFIYEIENIDITEELVTHINSISTRSKIIDRVQYIQQLGGKFQFLKPEKPIFTNNLVLIDSLLPEILSQILLDFYSGKSSHLAELVKTISEKNPLQFDVSNEHSFYEYKIKRLLTDVALGMMPSKVWTGKYDATGGYLIVKDNGEVLCYHIYNRNEFEDYLLNSTKLETPGSTRHGYGEIFKEGGKIFFKLNLQIRFIK